MPEEDAEGGPLAPPPIKGLETALTVFIGRAEKGPLNTPVQCLGPEAFEDAFCEVGPHFDLARAVRLFFVNGGRKCHVVRVASREDPSAAPRPNDYRDALDSLSETVDSIDVRMLAAEAALTVVEATADTLQEGIDALEEDVAELDARVDALETTETDAIASIEDLEAELDSLDDRVYDLEENRLVRFQIHSVITGQPVLWTDRENWGTEVHLHTFSST